MPTRATTIAHFSDLHRTATPLGWSLRDLVTRRLTGWCNWHVLGRGERFRDADRVAVALAAEFRVRQPGAIVFSGDAAGIGFEREIEQAAEALGVGEESLPPGFAVPGNHDYYTHSASASGAFERAFAAWQTGERVGGDRYPFARRFGELWFVAVNSAAPHRNPIDATGEVGLAQRNRLRDLLRQLPSGPRILVTHYPVRLANGRPETRWHGLRDLKEVVRIAADGGVSLWLHGHRHGSYVHSSGENCQFPVVCAGSASQVGKAGYYELTIDAANVCILRRVFDSTLSQFIDGPTTTIGFKS